MLIYELAALGSRHVLGSHRDYCRRSGRATRRVAFNWIRQVSVTVLLAILVLCDGIWQQLTWRT